MKNNIETCLTLDGVISLKAIDGMVHYNIKCMCFEEIERQLINKASESLVPDFLNILNAYFEIADGIDVNQCSDSLIEAVDGFVHNFKIQVLKNLNNQPVSTGLLFTWIPIVAMLNRSAKDTYAPKFQTATTHLESEVHKFAIIQLNHALNRQAIWLNNKQSQSHLVNFYKFKRSQPSLN